MNELVAWLSRLRSRQLARPDLFDALLSGRKGAYARYRLRFMFPRLLVRLMSHGFEIFVLAQVLPWEWFAPLLAYRASSSFFGGAYWGFLEALRVRVRHHARHRRYESARRLIEGWLGLGLGLALIALGGIAAWTYLGAAGGGLTLVDAYGWACYARLACEIVARTYHAGVFALQRVYRPLATLLVPDVLELAFVVLAFRYIGPWAIPLSIVLGGMLRATWAVSYAHRAYQNGRIGPPQLRFIPRSVGRVSPRDVGLGLVHALANGTAQIDSLLILALTQLTPSDPTQLPLSVVYYVLRPLMSAGHNWTRVFYFDWKRLEAGTGRTFQSLMRGMLLRVGVAMVLIVAGLLSVVALAVWGTRALPLMAALTGLLVVRAAFSLEQLEAFSLGHYRRLALMAVLFGFVLVMLLALRVTELELVVGAGAALVGALLWSRRLRLRAQLGEGPGSGVTGWLSKLALEPEGVSVMTLCAHRGVVPAHRVQRALQRQFPTLSTALVGRSHVVAFALANAAPAREHTLAAVGGALRELSTFDAHTGREAIAKLIQSDWFVRVLGVNLSVEPKHRDELIAEFRRRTPQGYVLELDRGRGVVSQGALPFLARRAVLREIAARAAGRRPRRHHGVSFRVAVFAPHGVAQLVFVAPHSTPGFAEFTRLAECSALSEGLRGLR